MKGLGARLRRALDATPDQVPASTDPAPAGSAAAPAPRCSAISEALARVRQRQAPHLALLDAPGPAPPWADAIPGEELSTEAGPVYVVEERMPLEGLHGALALGALFDAPTDHLVTLTGDPRLTGFDPSRALFLDIEATGLDHGAGTLAFVVGVGFREGDAFILRLLVLRDHADERALLLHLRELLERFDFLVSFNGKSYDLTVLQARLVMHRLYAGPAAALKLRPHLDLLHLSRSLYRNAWKDTRLSTLEHQLLGVTREDDVPGELVPSCWLAWLRRGDPRPMAKVVEHNRVDILSMVTLAERLVTISRPGACRDARVALNLGRLLFRRRALGAALDALAGLDLAEAHALRAACYRRRGDHASREAALRAQLACAQDDAAGWTQLAIVLERRRDLEGALDAARRAARIGAEAGADRRVARLEARIARLRRRGAGAVAGEAAGA